MTDNTSQKRPFTIDPSFYATHWQRIANYLIDYVVQVMIMLGIATVVATIAMMNGYSEKDIKTATESLSSLEQYALALVIILVYYNFFEILLARTVGKFITRTIVVDLYGNKPTANDILLRSICRAIPLEFIIFFGPDCRGWHDRLSDTYVVQTVLLEVGRKAFYDYENSRNQKLED